MACANKVIFQVTPRDARELAPEFAEKPVALESRRIPELVVCQDPMWHLLRRGHAKRRIMEIYRGYLDPYFIRLSQLKDEGEQFALQRTEYISHATLFSD